MQAAGDVLDAAVVGGGLAGLVVGERLQRAGHSVVVLEASDRPGGVVASQRVESAAGSFLFESGPHSVPGTARAFGALVDRLRLRDRLVTSTDAARRRELLWRGRLVALPTSALRLLSTPLVSLRTKWSFLGEARRRWSPPADGSEPTLHELVTERFGEDAARRVAGAFVRGVYAGDARELGVRSAFPRLWRGLLEDGSILRFLASARSTDRGGERGTLLSFVDGMGELPLALARELGDALQLRREVASLQQEGERWVVRLASGALQHARRVVLATPAATTHRLLAPHLGGDAVGERALASLAQQRSNGVRVVHLGLAAPLPPSWLTGFGFLVTPEEGEERGVRMLGTLAPSNVFEGRAPTGAASAACFHPIDDSAESPRDTATRARQELAAAIGAPAGALNVAVESVVDWPAHAGGIPSYAPGHDMRIAALEDALARCTPGLAIVGSYTRGVSVDDVIEQAGTVGDRFATGLAATSAVQP